MVSKGTLSVAILALPFAIFGQNPMRMAPVPGDPLELVTGSVQVADTAASREAALRLLVRAKNGFALRSARRGYDLKVTFKVDSRGQTDYDGAWVMEDLFDPQQGLRWTAKAAAGYATTQIFLKQRFYGAGTVNVIPLRLHEARAALFGPIATGNFDRALIRTSAATFNGAPVICILLSGSGNAATATSGRRWEETEDCINPQSGLLQTHSQAPGRYYAYDYSNAELFAGHTLPRKVIVTEAGTLVSEIHVESLTDLPAADPNLFIPTPEMRARGSSAALAGAQKISRFSGSGPFPPGATARPVCVFGLVTPSGKLIEAHSLQPSDPNSQAAVQAAKMMNFSNLSQTGTWPQQHFVFIIDKFVASPETSPHQ